MHPDHEKNWIDTAFRFLYKNLLWIVSFSVYVCGMIKYRDSSLHIILIIILGTISTLMFYFIPRTIIIGDKI